jgi:hypothetical protein
VPYLFHHGTATHDARCGNNKRREKAMNLIKTSVAGLGAVALVSAGGLLAGENAGTVDALQLQQQMQSFRETPEDAQGKQSQQREPARQRLQQRLNSSGGERFSAESAPPRPGRENTRFGIGYESRMRSGAFGSPGSPGGAGRGNGGGRR